MTKADQHLDPLTISHHPTPEMLLAYAAGALSEGAALAVACHASLCRDCSREIQRLNAIGGEIIAEADPHPLSDDAMERMLARLDEPEPDPRLAVKAMFDTKTEAIAPAPLRPYLPASLGTLAWQRVGRMFEEVRLPLSGTGVKAALMRIQPGRIMPRHSHAGLEYTVVLAGGYQDNGVAFRRGDYSEHDAGHEHQPVADRDGECLCLVVLDAPVRLTGFLGRLINPLLRI